MCCNKMPMLSTLSSKAVRIATNVSLASISTNAAIGLHLEKSAVQNFHERFWESFAARKPSKLQRIPDFVDSTFALSKTMVEKDKSVSPEEDDQDAILRTRARDDLLKHFHMSAALRAMKRGGGLMSDNFSLNNQTVQPVEQYTSSDALYMELPSLIDVATAREAREAQSRHFWASHQARKDSSSLLHPTFTAIVHPRQYQHKHRFKLPTTLFEAYLEFGRNYRSNNISHQPHPMAITEAVPPFQIVDVNKAWVDLCGYTREQAVGSTLKELLQGPETNVAVASSLASSLHEDDAKAEYEAVLVNYRSDGRSFKNHARVGRIKNVAGDIINFVGVFRKLSQDDELDSSNYEDVYANV